MSKPKRKPPQKAAQKPKLGTHFIRKWRKRRGKSQVELGEVVGMTGGNLSEIENSHTAYTQVTLEAIACALECQPADLLVRDPDDPEGIWTLWDRATPPQRRQLLGMIEAFLKGSPEGA